MKLKQRPKLQWFARTMVGTYAAFWLLWTLHPFLAPEHRHDHERQICRHQPTEKHIHSEEFAHVGCDFCHFAPAQSEATVLVWQLPEMLAQPRCLVFSPAAAPVSTIFLLSNPRAPPAPLA